MPTRNAIFSRALLAALTLLVGSASADNGPPAAAEPDANVLAEFDVAKRGDALLVPVTIDGRTYPFLVDTATTRTIFDESLRPFLGKPRSTGVLADGSGRAPVALFAAPAAEVGPLSFPPGSDVICLDLSELRKYSGYEICGALGMDFLGQFVVRIDFDQGKLQLLKEVPNSAGSDLPLAWTDEPSIWLQVPQIGLRRFLLSTGRIHGSLGIEPVLFDRLVRTGELVDVIDRMTLGALGTAKRRRASLKEFTVAGATLRHLVLCESGSNYVGPAFLSRFVVTFDFQNRRLYLEQGAAFGREEEFDLSGLVLTRVEGRTVVESIFPETPAANTGLKPGDVIVSVDGHEAGELTVFQIRRAFGRAGQVVRLSVRRDAELLKFEMQFEQD